MEKNETNQEYTPVEFSFQESDGRRGGKYYEITAQLLVTEALLKDIHAWKEIKESDDAGEFYKALLSKGAMLHCEDGPAYKKVLKSAFDHDFSETVEQEYWEKGVRQRGRTPSITIKDGFRR